MTLAERITQIKAHFGLNNRELGAIAGLSGQAIANLENGTTRNTKISSLSKISNELDLNLRWLVDGEGESGMDPASRTRPGASATSGNTNTNTNSINYSRGAEQGGSDAELQFLRVRNEEMKQEIAELKQRNDDLMKKNDDLTNKLLERL